MDVPLPIIELSALGSLDTYESAQVLVQSETTKDILLLHCKAQILETFKNGWNILSELPCTEKVGQKIFLQPDSFQHPVEVSLSGLGLVLNGKKSSGRIYLAEKKG
ncbi:MAG TPA: hypothetical protein VK737_12560 [Opitutales bacterium]|jgi:hypothetical protein|nr:hypothetical protein [Opitutales bacterium]